MEYDNKIISKEGVSYFQSGWKQTIGNITKIYLKGNNYQRGYQLGKLMPNEVKKVYQSFISYFIHSKANAKIIMKKFVTLAPPLFNLFLKKNFAKKVEKLIVKYPAWMVEELEGIAHGAGMDPFYLKFMNTMGDDHEALSERELRREAKQSCCSFAFMGEDGHLYHGKNLDWVLTETKLDMICLQQHEDEEGNWFALIGAPGILKAYEFGMNSHGISVGLTGRFYRGKNASKRVLTDTVELRILREGKNLKEIKQIYNTKTGFSRSDGLLISSFHDKDFNLFEVTPRGVGMTPAKDGTLFTTNTYINPAFNKNNRNWGNIYQNDFCDPRHTRLVQLLESAPRTLEGAFSILKDTVQPGLEEKSFLGQASLNRFITHVSALMVRGENPGVWIAKDRTYAASNQYAYFDFSGKPQAQPKTRPADDMIHTEKFKNFKKFVHFREMRYYEPAKKIIKGVHSLLTKEPDNPIFILYLAQSRIKLQQYDQAITILKEHPILWLADYWYCMGQSLSKTGLFEEAESAFSKAQSLPSIDGFSHQVKLLCMVQLYNIYRARDQVDQAGQIKEELEQMKEKFATPNIGMPQYPYINNILEQFEQIQL